MNLHREVNQDMLKALECLVIDAIRFPENRELSENQPVRIGQNPGADHEGQ